MSETSLSHPDVQGRPQDSSQVPQSLGEALLIGPVQEQYESAPALAKTWEEADEWAQRELFPGLAKVVHPDALERLRRKLAKRLAQWSAEERAAKKQEDS